MQMEPRTILVVDDYAPNLVALEAALEPLEQRVVKVSSGEEALKFLLSEGCALIVLWLGVQPGTFAALTQGAAAAFAR